MAPEGVGAPMLFDRPGLGGDYERLMAVQDRRSGLHAVLALHRTVDGLAGGGIRRYAYASEEAQVADALRLAAGMTAKLAFAQVPCGGGKTVMLDHPRLDKAGAYRALGRAVEELGGRYVCGPDVGTGKAELAFVREGTRHVNAPGNDANASTAAGVLAGLRATVRALDDGGLAGRRFLVQGLGGVGGAVARQLLAEGAQVLGADVQPSAVEAARAAGVLPVPAEAALSTPCDVLVPCALGGVMTREAGARLRARAVCGSANNQLAEPEVAGLLHAQGVLYVPDFTVNAGAAIEGVLTHRFGATAEVRAEAARHVAGTEQRVADLLQEAARRGVPPLVVAEERTGVSSDPPKANP